jgi:hypothetical protein
MVAIQKRCGRLLAWKLHNDHGIIIIIIMLPIQAIAATIMTMAYCSPQVWHPYHQVKNATGSS